MRQSVDQEDRNSGQWRVLAGIVVWEEGAGEAAASEMAGKKKHLLSN